jgi:hypothetical protein
VPPKYEILTPLGVMDSGGPPLSGVYTMRKRPIMDGIPVLTEEALESSSALLSTR